MKLTDVIHAVVARPVAIAVVEVIGEAWRAADWRAREVHFMHRAQTRLRRKYRTVRMELAAALATVEGQRGYMERLAAEALEQAAVLEEVQRTLPPATFEFLAQRAKAKHAIGRAAAEAHAAGATS